MAKNGRSGGRDSWLLSRLGLLLVLGVASTALLTIGAFLLPHWDAVVGHYRGAERLTSQDAIRGDGLKVAAGVAVIIAGIFTWARIEIAKGTQLTDRYQKAVELLGHEDLAVQVGSLYALERIGKDSETDRPAVWEVISAYVRYQTTRARDGDNDLPIVRFEVQSALTILGRRDAGWDTEDVPVDLHGAILFNGNLRGANLVNANLVEADLSGAILTDAILTRADLTDADLTDSVSGNVVGMPKALPFGWFLINGYLIGPGAGLDSADLSGLDLTGADLTDTYFLAANLTGANLTDTELSGADFSWSTLVRANLAGADLNGCDLSGADLSGADLTGATLVGANLGRANLTRANLSAADFDEAKLFDADLTQAIVDGALLKTAYQNSNTIWPDGLDTSGFRPFSD